jgi:hypothetical protein
MKWKGREGKIKEEGKGRKRKGKREEHQSSDRSTPFAVN